MATVPVMCKKCGHFSIDPLRKGRQKYCQVRCISCGYVLPNRRHDRDPFGDRRKKNGK